MSGPPSDDNESAPMVGKPGRQIRWDAAAAVIAALVGLLALLVAGYTAYIQRQQVRAQVWPYLMWANSADQAKYMWTNKGVGPAVIKSVQVLVDGQPRRNWDEVLHALQESSLAYGQSSFNNSVVSAGETLDWIQFQNRADFQAFRQAARQGNLSFKVCYCSTLGDCWLDDTTKGPRGNNTRIAVDRCPAVPQPHQFDD